VPFKILNKREAELTIIVEMTVTSDSAELFFNIEGSREKNFLTLNEKKAILILHEDRHENYEV
jgi:hypothetical protein